ncbi:unnamed protein product, partial [Laminaria digitata]
MWERRAGYDSRRDGPSEGGGADAESVMTTVTPADRETRGHVRRPSSELGALSGVANMKAMFEKKAATFAERQRQEEEFALHTPGGTGTSAAGARGATTCRPLSRRLPRRAASSGAAPP